MTDIIQFQSLDFGQCNMHEKKVHGIVASYKHFKLYI